MGQARCPNEASNSNPRQQLASGFRLSLSFSSCHGIAVISPWVVIVLLASVGTGFWVYATSRRSKPSGSPFDDTDEPSPSADLTRDSAPISYTTEAIETALGESYKLTFGVTRFDYRIMAEHAAVLERAAEAADASVLQRDYFPRRPMLLPKLMQAINDPEISRETLVRLIMEDPAIAGGVLKQANTAFYRVSPARVDNIDRAVWLLGTEGLRRLMATAIMQPVFRLPKGYFESFAPLTWEQAQRAAAAAEAYAENEPECDPFVAQLLAVLEPLAHIVVFRLVMEKYRESPNILPRAEVFIRAMQRHSKRVALRIAGAWEMSHESVATLSDQAQRTAPSEMRELSRAVYYANLTGVLSLVAARKKDAETELWTILCDQGLSKERAQAIWQAAMSSCEG
jgi:HD-like signal output (HDOD) protein